MLPRHTIVRTTSILITALLTVLLSDYRIWQTLVFSLGFSHYAMSLYYSRRQATRVLGQPSSYLPLAITLMFGGLLYLKNFPLVVFFAVHHVCNEVYMLKYSDRVEAHPKLPYLRASSLFLQSFTYAVILHDHRALQFLDLPFLYGGLALSLASFVYFLTALSPSMTRRELIDASSFEVTGLLLVGLSSFVQITFLQIVCYHFVLWIIYPMEKIGAGGSGELVGYLGWTIGLTAFFFALSPLGALGSPASASVYYPQFVLWSYIHISTSFALSSGHPGWITRWFKPRPVLQPSAQS